MDKPLDKPLDKRSYSPASARNRQPILEVLERVLPSAATVLELASGSGEHAIYFSKNLPHLTWQPSDVDDDGLASVESWVEHEALPNVRKPLRLDVCADDWIDEPVDAIYCCNMIHITPWEMTEALMRGVGKHLKAGGRLVTYGPYRIGDEHTAPSNASFDHSLRSRDARWGVRDFEAVSEEAKKNGLVFVERVAMPANNFILVFRKDGA